MSIICKSRRGWALDHASFIQSTFMMVQSDSIEKSSQPLCLRRFCFNKNLFKILTPFLFTREAENVISKTRKRKRKYLEESSRNNSEMCAVKSALEDLVTLAKEKDCFLMSPCEEDFIMNNKEARSCSDIFFKDVCVEKLPKCNGGNSSDIPVSVNISDQTYLIPNNSRFFCCDVRELKSSLPEHSKFDFILLDPPWWNKYVRRRKSKQETDGYEMMYNEEVGTLPVESWLAPDALVAVWCTNCSRHMQDIISQWFPKWNLHHVATWYWIKVTCNGEPVCSFSPPPGKQPYERIVFGAKKGRQYSQPPNNLCLVSVPSAVHSHKPPLSEVMKTFLPSEPRCLELFARYLLPNWTSAGDQVLALQNLKLYQQVEDKPHYDTSLNDFLL